MAMNESDIVAQQPHEETTPDSEIQAGISIDKEFTPLYKHFGVEPSPRTDEALEKIWNYGKEQAVNKEDKEEIIFQIIRFGHELGSPALGESAYAKMHNYINIFERFKRDGKMLEELKKRNG